MRLRFPILVLLVCASRSTAEDLLRFDFSKVAASFPLEERSKAVVAGSGLTMAIERPFARPQDRYVEVLLQIAPDGGAESSRLRMVSRIVAKDPPGFHGAIYAERTGVRMVNVVLGKVSHDNGQTWETFAPKPDYRAGASLRISARPRCLRARCE